MKKRWKSLIAWILIITMAGGHGNVAWAADSGAGTLSGAGSRTQQEAGMNTL